MIKKIISIIIIVGANHFLVAQTTNCDDNIGGQITVGSSCLFIPWNSTNASDYWNNAAGCGATDRDDVWGWFVATSNSTTLTYSPNTRDAVMHLFQVDAGNCSSNMTAIACADDFGNGGDETIVYPTTIGLVYRIRIQRFNSNNVMTGDICVYNTPTAIDGQNCVNPTRVDCGEILVGETTTGFVDTESDWSCSTIPGNNNTAGEDHFYVIEWPEPSAGGIIRLSLSNTGDNDNTYLEIYNLGNSCNPDACVDERQLITGVDDFFDFSVPAGVMDYYFVIDCQQGDYDTYDIEFTCFYSGITLDDANSCTPIPSTEPLNQGFYQTWDGVAPPDTVGAGALSQNGPYTICENLYIQNESGFEWLKYFTISLGSCWINPTNLTPNGNNTQQNSGASTGDWAATIGGGTPNVLNWEFTHDDVSSWGDGNGGFYSCNLYTFCFDIEVDSSCSELYGFRNSISARDDGTSIGGQNVNTSTVTINNTSETVLPVTLLSYDVNDVFDKERCGVLINWKTASEVNNEYFTIERSTNGLDFIEIIKIKGGGNSNSIRNYMAVDESPLLGVNYYRLKQTDIDGKYTYLGVESATCNQMNDVVRIYPNPTKNDINIELGVLKRETDIKIYNSMGLIVYSKITTQLKEVIDISSKPKGVYFIHIRRGEELEIHKMVKK